MTHESEASAQATSTTLGDHPTRKQIIAHWDPENPVFWEKYGKKVAQRNLVVSIIALLITFCINTLAAQVSAQLGNAGFAFNAGQLFLLTALPGLIGATGRLVYTYLPALMGGRNFTLITTGILLIPLVGIGCAVMDTTTPFWAFAAWFSFLGLALSVFSGSMANIGFFFPIKEKGTANGLNAGIGNLGVAVTIPRPSLPMRAVTWASARPRRLPPEPSCTCKTPASSGWFPPSWRWCWSPSSWITCPCHARASKTWRSSSRTSTPGS